MLDLMTLSREQLRTYKHPRHFEPQNLSMGTDFRLTIYEQPVAGDTYVLGSDFCQGIAGADYDYGVVLNKATNPVRQVAEVVGRWGPDRYDRVLYALARYYLNAFIVGERQFGLPVLRSLATHLHYTYLYYQRDEAARGRDRSDLLGHHKGAGDPLIPMFRMAVRDGQVMIVSEVLHEQLRLYKFLPKNPDKEDLRDPDMRMSAPAGAHDDGVNAGAYAWKGIQEVHHYVQDKPMVEEGKAGDRLGMKDALQIKPKNAPPPSPFRGYERPVKR